MFGLGLKIAIVACGLSLIGGGVMYVKMLQAEIETAHEQQAKLESALESEKKVVERQTKDVERMRDLNSQISKNLSEAQKEKSALDKKFRAADSKRMTSTSLKDPKAIEDRINRGTKYALRCNEITTGAPIELEDKTNNICPDLIKKKTQ